MDIILFNPLSKNGKAVETVLSLETDLQKQGNYVKSINILDVGDIDAFVASLNYEDRVIIVGGDGTLHKLANRIYHMGIKNEILMYGAGTGNDFVRSLRTKKKLISISKHLENLPYALYNGKKERFLNGVGVGLDGLVCYKVNNSTEEKNSWNYFKNTIRAFRESKKFKTVEIEIDGKTEVYKNVWLSAFMNSQYLGGGMKMAPKARRTDRELYMILVKRIPKFLVLFVLPSVYLGFHKIFAGVVKIVKINEYAKVKYSVDGYMQADGEVEYPVSELEVHVYEKKEE